MSRGEKYAYFILDGLIGNGINFICCAMGFYLNDLIGLAWGWSVGSFLTSFLLLLAIFLRYSLPISLLNVISVIGVSIIGSFLYIMLSGMGDYPFSHIISGVLLVSAILYSLYRLRIIKVIKSRFIK